MLMLLTSQHRRRFVALLGYLLNLNALMLPTNQIDVRDLSISIGGREILAHAELKLHENVHYVLAGRNGVGKSSMCGYIILLSKPDNSYTYYSASESISRGSHSRRAMEPDYATPRAIDACF
jgi:ABC-type transporter Mla maintaining outer membrane lipid asymmetry ATPase subunit MlaF